MDMDSSGLVERIGNLKYHKDEVKKIIGLYDQGKTIVELSRELNIPISTLWGLLTRKHIEGPKTGRKGKGRK